MNPIRIWQVDAFTDQPFRGNPAAVCWLEHPASDAWMLAVAAEMNLAETAFLLAADENEGDVDYDLRWFTPVMEVDLCGHATLASAHILWEQSLRSSDRAVSFRTRSGRITCRRRGATIAMDFPATPARQSQPADGLLDALGLAASPHFVGKSIYDYLVVVDRDDQVRALSPDFRALSQVDARGVIVSSRSDDPGYDFTSRFFAPAAGIDEDPVTGSAHCCLGPYWSDHLGKSSLTGFQASPRSGVVQMEVGSERVTLLGQAVTVLHGELAVKAS